ncbi:MAG: C10 family peptidase, partial [Candidatus Cloacimonadaceae bacterium]|nr:C10 family peptidase [Candidatus Cloacimonadaceae bacterium]
MKTTKCIALILFAVMLWGAAYAESLRTVDPMIFPQWHQTNPWNGQCPGTGQNRAHAGSHALAMAKVMRYWAYPTYGTGSVSYVDDNYGPINQNFTSVINWSNMSNTLVFQTTLRYIFMIGASIYTNYEPTYSTSSLTNIRTALMLNFSYDTDIQLREREDYTNFYWKNLIRQELDNNRPVIYAATLSNGTEVAFIIDGYNAEGLFHINWSDVNYANSWVDLNELTVWGQAVAIDNQFMLTGIRPSLGPPSIDENFETDFSNFNWQFSGQANWTISTETSAFGSQSAKSGNINDNQFTSMFIQINVTEDDTISFYKRVSCEAEPNHLYDHLAFFIDGVEQERWSGDGVWAYHEYPVSAGVREFRWTYSKDGASVYFGDCAWVDAIDFPVGTTPLNPPRFVEAGLVSGNSVRLDWAPPEGVNPSLLGYRINRNGTQVVQYNNPNLVFH